MKHLVILLLKQLALFQSILSLFICTGKHPLNTTLLDLFNLSDLINDNSSDKRDLFTYASVDLFEFL